LFINLTPFIPLSLKGEGEDYGRGASAPLKHPDFGELKRGKASLSSSPPSLGKGRGQGDRLIHNLIAKRFARHLIEAKVLSYLL